MPVRHHHSAGGVLSMQTETFVLRLTDVVDTLHWTWRLESAVGELLAEHRVALDPASAMVDAWINLLRYLHDRTFPPRLLGRRRATLAALADWVRSEILGPIAGVLDAAPNAHLRVVLLPSTPAMG